MMNEAAKTDVTAALCRAFDVSPETTRRIISPYRICPLGAHSDHQGGEVLGMAISARTELAFAPTDDGHVAIRSRNFHEPARFSLAEPGPPVASDWSKYARGAAVVLADRLPASPRGIVAWVDGTLPGGGLSSSASIDLAYVLALATVNEVALDPRELALCALSVETDYLGLKCGLLDPAAIAAARKDRFLLIDCANTAWRSVEPGPDLTPFRILIAYSGLSRNLTETGFNDRVDECRQAAREIAERTGHDAAILGDLPEDVLQSEIPNVAPHLSRRARHFLTERQRVREATRAWSRGDVATIGTLMDASCQSSIHDYECGSPELIALQALLSERPEVFGCRFSGGGYGGCCVALVAADSAEAVRAETERQWLERHPDLAGTARFFLVDSDDGVRIA